MALYTYQNDASGRQLWLFGPGPIVGNTATIGLLSATGTGFGLGFDREDVLLDSWGDATVTRTACDRVDINWASSQFGSGNMMLQPLTLVSGNQPACP